MKVKTFILSLLLTMFCSTSFGQHWGEIPNHYDGNMTFVTQIFIDGVLQGNDIEIGAFYDGEFRGSARPIVGQANMVYLLIEGDANQNGKQISFKLARHYADRPSEELGNVIFNALTYVDDARIGGSPAQLDNNGLLPEEDRTEFNSVARLNGKVYPSLANALAACTTGSNTIELLKDNAEDVTIKQVEGVNVTIDGGTSRFDYSGTITIHGNARHDGAETLTFKNIDFTTDKAGHYFIDSNSTDSDKRYAHNVTVDDCNFTATGPGINSAVAMRIRQGFDIAINGGTFTDLHSALQAYGNAGITVSGITLNGKNGISAGTSTGVVIENSNITATGYGLRADGTGAYDMTLKGANSITAELPVVVRNTTGAYKLTVESGTYTALNGNPAVTFTTGDDGTFVAPTADATATIADGVNVTTFGLEAKIANDYYTIVANAATAASNETGDQTIVLIKDATSTVNPLNVEILDLNAKTLTANVIGKVKTNGGLWITPENFKMIGVGADYYTTDNATIVMGANYALRMTEGTVTLAQSWRTLPGQTVAIESYAKFIVPAGMTYQIYGTAVAAAGTLEVNGTVQLAQLDATLTAEAGLNVVSGVDGYVVKYENGVYKLVAGNVLNVNTGKKYDKISSAIADATADNKLQLLQDITEDVTITKNITLDGAGKNYTGKITLNKVNFTVENVNFVKGNIYKNKNTGVGGTYTIKNCTFDGQSMNDYAVNLGGTSAIVIEGVTAKDYGYGFLQVPTTNTSVSVKDVEISNVNYGLKIDYSGGVTLENVKAVASVAGVLNSNFGAKTITIKNSELSILGTWERGTNLTTTYLFEGNNTIGQFVTEDALDIFKLTKTDATLTAPEGKTVTTDISGYVVKYEDGKYIVVGANVQVKDGDEVKGTFATLAEAITAAQAGNTIVLLNNITEDVTVDKSVTIDGANKNYTGNISVSGTSTAITVKNVNFVNGTGYAITTNRIKSVTVEDCTVTDYGFGFLYANKSTPTVVVKNVTVEGGNYGFHWVYGTTATLENVTMTNVTYGLYIQNYAGKTINVKNSTISSIAIWERSGYSGVQTFKFEGANTVDTLTDSQYAKYVLAAADATLTAPEGYNVTSGVDNLEVIYKNGCYSLYGLSGSGAEEDPFLIYNLEDLKFFRDHVNAGKTRYNAENVYVALAANIDMASEDWSVNIGDDCNYTFDGIFDGNGFTISNLKSTETAQKADGYVCTGLFGAIYGNAVIKDLTIENVNINTGEFTGNNVAAVVGFVYGVSGKTVTIDGVKVTGDINIDASGVYGVGAIVGYSYNQGTLNIKNCAVEANDESAITAVSGSGAIIGYCGGKATIEACSVQNIDITAKGLVGGIAGITENSVNKVLSGNTVKDVTLTATKTEWVNSTAIAVGTMDGNGLTVANTIFENVNASRMVGSVYAEQPTYVVPAVEARIENKYYGTFDAALAAAQEGNTITVLAPVVITEDMTYNLTGLSVVGENVYPIFRIQNGANVVVANGNISNDDYVFVLGASDGSSAGNLTIESGVYTGTTTVASVTKGLLKINGGEFKVNNSEYGATYMINCIDANYNDDSANVEIYGGKFYGFNPEDNDAEGANTNFCAPGYAANEIETGVYEVVAGMVLNQTKGIKYATLSAAIAAATAGDTLVLLADITENVTVDKKLTIDGDGHNSTGLISTNKNVTYTFKNFNIDGANSYFVKVTDGGGNYVFDNCNIKNSWGLIYTNKSTNTVSVKNSIVDNCEYGVAHFTALNSATLENVTVQNSARGLMVQNQAAKTIKFVGCNISATEPVYIWDKGTSIITLNFEGENTFDGELGVSTTTYGKLVLTTTGTTLTAPEGLNVTTSVAGHIVDYADGKYYLRVPNYVAAIGETKYESLQAAIDAAVDNDVIVVIDNIEVTIDDLTGLQLVGTKYPSYYVVRGKTISIDLNGMMIKANVSATDMLLGLFSTEQSGNLTLKDSSNGNGKVEIVATNDADVYSLITNYEETSSITINNGNYRLNKTGKDGQSLIYDSPGNMVINGGNFYLGNIGTDGVNNGLPWIFNCYGKDQGNVTVNGGTFNADVNHQHWAHEVYVPNTLALKDNGNGTWTVVDAVAQGTDSWRGYGRSLGYASIADAAHWAKAETTVTVVADHAITETAIVERNLTLDMNDKAVTAQDIYPVIRIQNDANVTVKNGNITNNDYVFVLGASDGSSAGNLTIESGVYTGTTTVASVTKGLLTINGGEFKVNDSEYGATYMINCIDANYNDDLANVEIYGGKFYGFNPENNAAEGANTNFCAEGYGAIENPTDVWTVVPKQTAEVKDGWNWFSYYVEGDVLKQLQNSLGTVGVQIKSRTAFTQYSNGNWNGDLVSTTPAESYKINVNADTVINVTGNIVDPSTCDIMLNNGGTGNGAWNWIGYPLAQKTSVETAFAGVVKNGDQVKTSGLFAEYVGGRWWGNLMTLEPGVGYMYFRAGANETVSNFTYPTPSSKEAVQPNITADANLWVPNSTSYANNMTMVAVLNMNGEMMNDNYEVAAMVNGEVRGSARPIYVEPMDAYMLFLTIHGEGVEEVTFQCYDFNTDTEYVLNNTINYSDDARLGSVNEPYVLCYGTMGIGENSIDNINIYPNPTTTDREINLQATCDKVEVFNALGVKVAEYHNVDTLDAIETAGIYVIRVTNDGDVKHCRLVVK